MLFFLKYTLTVHYPVANPHEECCYEDYNPAVVDIGC